MNVDIRPATREDIADVQDVAERAWYEAHAPIIGEETTEAFLDAYYDAEAFRTLVDAPERVFDVADAGGSVVGFVSGGPDEESPGTFNLNRVYVHPERWRDGVGRQLLDHFERKVAERGRERISLGVMAENDRAISFYEAAGYHQKDTFYDENIDTESYVFGKELDG